MGKIACLLGAVFTKFDRAIKYCKKQYQLGGVEHGKCCYLGDHCFLTPKRVKIGDDVSIGKNCCFQSTHGLIEIGDHVMFGPGVHIHGGNHKWNEIGRYMKDATQKDAYEDGIVKIGSDCWIGANAIILKGVEIGKGSIVGAGAVVTHNLPPYTVYVGVKSPCVRSRFTKEEIMEHERLLRERYGEKEDTDNS